MVRRELLTNEESLPLSAVSVRRDGEECSSRGYGDAHPAVYLSIPRVGAA